VIALVRDQVWSGKDSFAKLHRLLVASGCPDVPSVDTLARAVRQLQVETGEPGLLRPRRVRQKATPGSLPQNSPGEGKKIISASSR
jgi:hypothetical protein